MHRVFLRNRLKRSGNRIVAGGKPFLDVSSRPGGVLTVRCRTRVSGLLVDVARLRLSGAGGEAAPGNDGRVAGGCS
jgi:hypothetical protein